MKGSKFDFCSIFVSTKGGGWKRMSNRKIQNKDSRFSLKELSILFDPSLTNFHIPNNFDCTQIHHKKNRIENCGGLFKCFFLYRIFFLYFYLYYPQMKLFPHRQKKENFSFYKPKNEWKIFFFWMIFPSRNFFFWLLFISEICFYFVYI